MLKRFLSFLLITAITIAAVSTGVLAESEVTIETADFMKQETMLEDILPKDYTPIGDERITEAEQQEYIETMAIFGDWEYTINDDNATVTITKYKGTSSEVVIPSGINEFPVVGIGNLAFAYRSGLTSITIPDSVTSIGDQAFSACSELAFIEVSEDNSNYSSIEGVLYSKDKTTLIAYPVEKNETEFSIPNNVTSIGDGAFYYCSKLTSITIPNGVTNIGDGAFYYCSKLTSITIPNGVTNIGDSAFSCCYSLTSITIPDSVTSIGERAFYDCRWLVSIIMPNSVMSIGNSVFDQCFRLASIKIPNSVTSIGDKAFSNCHALTSITIPNNVISIGDEAFSSCPLTSIAIPNSVISIGDRAFSYCYSLTSITIPDSVINIGDGVFSNCTNLTSLEISKSNPKYSSIENIIYNKDKTTLVAYSAGKKEAEFSIPNSVTSIRDYTFYGCRSLVSIKIPNSVTSIGNQAFWNCSKLTSITIPDGVTNIGNSTFSYCSSLTSITIPNSVISIGDWAFAYCSSLTSITIPNSVTSIGDWAFYNCSNLASIAIPNGITSIGYSAFSRCTSLTSITIPNSVTSIGDQAFYNCSSLTSITIPNSVTYIGGSAFHDCINLTIYGYKDSYAETYAKNKGITFKLIDNSGETIPVTSVVIPFGNGRLNIGETTKLNVWVLPNNATNKNVTWSSNKPEIATVDTNGKVTAIAEGTAIITVKTVDGGFEHSCTITVLSNANDNLKIGTAFFDVNSDVATGKVANVPITVRDSYFSESSTKYNHNLAKLSMSLSASAYNSKWRPTLNQYIKSALNDLGFEDLNFTNYVAIKDTEANEIGLSLGHKTISVNNETFDLIVIVCRGTEGGEWYSNFNLSKSNNGKYDDKIHNGFDIAALGSQAIINEYINNYVGSSGRKKKILLTGHSRGGAVANLLGAKITKENKIANKHDIFTYTFATPNVEMITSLQKDSMENIFNIVNPEDFVTCSILNSWGYNKYGKDLVLLSKDKAWRKEVYSEMNNQFKTLTDSSFTSFKNGATTTQKFTENFHKYSKGSVWGFYNIDISGIGKKLTCKDYTNSLSDVLLGKGGSLSLLYSYAPIIKDITSYFISNHTLQKTISFSHAPETYVSWLKAGNENEVFINPPNGFIDPNSNSYQVTVKCPVDVNVYDSNNVLVGKVANNIIDETIEDNVPIIVENDVKHIYLPSDEIFKVEVIGTDAGTMDYTVCEIDAYGEEIQRHNIYDIPLEVGKTLVANIDNTQVDEPEYNVLNVVDSKGEVIETVEADEIITKEEQGDICITTTATEGGQTFGSGNYTKGDYVTLNTILDQGYVFVGWYENGNKIEGASENYSFYAHESRELEAKLEKINGFSLIGKVKTYNPNNSTNITLKQNGEIKYTTTIEPIMGAGQVEQVFQFENIFPGTYTLEVAKQVHTTFIVNNIVISNQNVDLTQDNRQQVKLITPPCGDINGNGNINTEDLSILLSSNNFNKSTQDAVNNLADVDGNGNININDLSALLSTNNFNKGNVTID